MAPWPTTPHTIDRWDDATGANLIEQIAGVGDYLVALATYPAAVRRWPGAKITLRNRARVIEQSWEEAYPGRQAGDASLMLPCSIRFFGVSWR